MSSQTPQLFYSAIIGHAICPVPHCGVAVKLHLIHDHLKTKHHATSDTISSIQASINEQHTSSIANSPHPLLPSYIATTNDASKNSYQPLPPIPHLPIHSAIGCPHCPHLSITTQVLKRHIKDAHPGLPITCTPTQTIQAQTLFKGKHTSYFRVLPDSTSSSILPHDFHQDIHNFTHPPPSSTPNHDADPKSMNAFLATMRFDIHLNHLRITMPQAVHLTTLPSSNIASFLQTLLSKYLKKAWTLANKKVHIKSHIFMGRQVHLSLKQQSIDRYERALANFIFFVSTINSIDAPESLSIHIPTNISKSFRDLTNLSSEMPQTKSLSILHDLFFHCFFTPLACYNHLTTSFISCFSVTKGPTHKPNHQRFKTATEMSPILAALKYAAQCCAVYHIYAKPLPTPSLTPWKLIQDLTDPNADTGIIYIDYLLQFSHSIRPTEMQKIRFVPCSLHPNCGFIDGVELSLPTLGDKMVQLQNKAFQIINQHLLLNLNVSEDFYRTCLSFQDAIHDRAPSSWFGVHPANAPFSKLWIDQFIHANSDHFFNHDKTLQTKHCHQFIDNANSFQAILFTLLTICSGGPARGSELQSLRIKNTPTAARNIYFRSGQIFFVILYHKSRSMNNGSSKPIARFPDIQTSKLLLLYLFFIKPFEHTLNTRLLRSRNLTPHTDAHCLLFTHDLQPIAERTATSWFHHTMHGLSIPFNISQYRQYHSGITKNLSNPFDDHNQVKQNTFLHLQAGHTERTAHNMYALSSQDLKELTGTLLHQYRAASRSWHQNLGLYTGHIALSTSLSNQHPPSNSSPPQHPHSSSSILQALNSIISNQKRIIERLNLLENNAKRPSSSPKDIDNVLTKKTRPNPMQLQTSPPPNIDVLLSTFLGHHIANPTFRSQEQKRAVQHSLSPNTDCITILPTGAGKSLIFHLPAFAYPQKISILVVPLLALQDDHLRRAHHYKIDTVKWAHRDSLNARIILVSPEHLLHNDYNSFINEKAAQGLIHAIYIDEAHLVPLWANFRSSLLNLHSNIRPNNVKVPIIALTATCSPASISLLKAACGLSSTAITIRATTSRPNIHYIVQESQEDCLILDSASYVCEQLKKHSSTPSHFLVFLPTVEKLDSVYSVFKILCPSASVFKYHAKMDEQAKQAAYHSWISPQQDKPAIMVATSAFGCGIDCSTVRTVLHIYAPDTIVDYIQQSGRAGRDGSPATAILFIPTPSTSSPNPIYQDIPTTFDSMDCIANRSTNDTARYFGSLRTLRSHSPHCRRWLFDSFLDGNNHTKTCQERSLLPCDVCQRTKPQTSPLLNHQPSTPRPTLQSESPLPLTPHIPTPQQPSSQSIPMSTNSASSKTSKTLVNDLNLLLDSFSMNCPICSIQYRRLIDHSYANGTPPCYKAVCLRCTLPGHSYTNCPYIPLSKEASNVCYSCSIGFFDGIKTHKPHFMGKRNCPFRRILGFCLQAWENIDIKQELLNTFPYLRSFPSTQAFSHWLRTSSIIPDEKTTTKKLGVMVIAPWIFENIFNKQVPST